MTFEKNELLAFAVQAPVEAVLRVSDVAQVAWVKLDLKDCGFMPFRDATRIGSILPDETSLIDWIESVRHPRLGEEFRDKTIRNQMVYEVEKLGEFAMTLQARVQGRLHDYKSE